MRVGIYARVSTDIQAKEGDSIQAQLSALREYAKKNNYEVAGEFVDDGISGTLLDERDELQHLLEYVRRGEIDLILFTRLDRWFRSIRHYLNVQDQLDRYGVPWRAIWEQFETQTPQGRFMVNQTLSFAQYESETAATRIRHVFDFKKTNREILSGKIPYGYKIQDKHLVIDPDKAEIVRRVFQMYIDTGSVTSVLRKAEGLGLPRTQRGTKILLQNRKYIGECYGIENYHEPIIDKEKFELVQEMLNQNVRKPQVRNFIFSGLCTCGDCGKRLMGTSDVLKRTGERYKIYRCPGHYRAIKDCPNTKSLNEKKLEKYLVTNLKTLAFADVSASDRKKAVNYEKKIANTGKKIARLKDLYINELITLDDYKHDLEAYKADIDGFKEKMKKYKGTDKNALKALVGRNLADWYWTLSDDEKKTIWRSVIDRIYFDNNRNIRVVFR